ncbi:MAG: peptidyl-prolyl cis-trans isomerase, partial [Bdellovibrionia bacterium]
MMYSKVLRAALFIFCAGSAALSCTSNDRSTAEQPVMTVNSKKLSTKEFAELLASKLKPFDALYAKHPENVRRVKEDILQGFITTSLVEEWADANGVKVTDAELEAAVQKIRGQYPDDISFRGAFANEGLSFENWRARLKRTLLEEEVFKEVSKSVSVPTEAEALENYKANKAKFQSEAKIHLRQIVVEKEDDSRRILDELKKGKSFEKLAKEFSVGPEAKQGGDVGWVDKGTLEVFDSAFTLAVGRRSDVVKSPYGFHIFEVLGKKPASQLNFEGHRATILKNLREKKEQEEYLSWLKRQLQKARVLR